MLSNFLKKRKDVFDYQQPRLCSNCSNEFQGRFCNKCGQKVVEQNERTVRHFLAAVFNAFTFVDGKFWNSIKILLTQPGRMSLDISEGKRKPYMQPLGLFFVGNLIYFLFPIFQTFNTGLYSQMGYMSYSKVLNISSFVEGKIDQNDTTFEELSDAYALKSKEISKTALLLIVVFVSIFFSLTNYSKTKLFSDHILFGLEFSSFIIHYLTNLLGALFLLIGSFLSIFGDEVNLIRDDFFALFSIPLTFYFLIRGIKTFYRTTWFISVVKSMLSLITLIISIELFRLFVFFMTMSLL